MVSVADLRRSRNTGSCSRYIRAGLHWGLAASERLYQNGAIPETTSSGSQEHSAGQGWKITGEPVFARYDPPFQLPFFRRNEVLIPIE